MSPPSSELTQFRLDGCREIWEKMDGKPERFFQIIELIENSAISNPSLCFDAAKGLIETTCKIIISKANAGFNLREDLPKLLKETVRLVELLPEDYDNGAEIEGILKRVISGLITTVTAIGELRSKEGLISHGAIGRLRQLDSLHAIFVAKSVDAVVQMLYSAFINTNNIESGKIFENNEDFNLYLDKNLKVRENDDNYTEIYVSDSDIVLIQFRKSLLFYQTVKPEYEILLGEFKARDSTEEEL